VVLMGFFRSLNFRSMVPEVLNPFRVKFVIAEINLLVENCRICFEQDNGGGGESRFIAIAVNLPITLQLPVSQLLHVLIILMFLFINGLFINSWRYKAG